MQLQLARQRSVAAALPIVPQKHAHLRWFCNDWTYVRYLRARFVKRRPTTRHAAMLLWAARRTILRSFDYVFFTITTN